MTNSTSADGKIRIGTRGSPLALAQAREVAARLVAAHDHLSEDQVDIVSLSTKGDRIQNQPLSEIGGKGLFTEEIEAGLLNASLDLAVHSMKDVPTILPDGLGIACLLPREDVRDAFLSDKAPSLAALPEGSVVGTASLRRQAQILRAFPHLQVTTFRGNVQTRMRKLSEGVVDATMLAMAGLNRLGLSEVVTQIIETDTMLPAIAQGAIGIETRLDDDATNALLAPLNHEETALCVTAERACLRTLDGSCRTPIGGLATLEDDQLTLKGQVLLPDGTDAHEATLTMPASDPQALGQAVGDALLSQGWPGMMKSF